MATTQSDMILRLRRLIDDVGNGYSQSAPEFDTDLTDDSITTPRIGFYIDDDVTQTDITLSPLANLSSGMAIASAIQRGLRAAHPEIPGYANAVCTFHRKDGYVIRSGTYGSHSRVEVVPPLTGNDIVPNLKLGLSQGGYESEAQLGFSDEELGVIVDDSLNVQNNTGEITSWEYDTLPPEYATVVTYRSWSRVIDTMLGRSAHYFPQKVSSEETSPNVIFDNLFRLAKWLKQQLDDILDGLESQVDCSSILRWDRELQKYVGDNSYYGSGNYARLNAALAGTASGEALVEFEPVLTLDAKHVFVAYSTAPGVWDTTKLTETEYSDPGRYSVSGLGDNSTLARELTSMKYPLVKITGLTPGQTYYFAIQVTDQNGNRYFSNEVSVDLPA